MFTVGRPRIFRYFKDIPVSCLNSVKTLSISIKSWFDLRSRMQSSGCSLANQLPSFEHLEGNSRSQSDVDIAALRRPVVIYSIPRSAAKTGLIKEVSSPWIWSSCSSYSEAESHLSVMQRKENVYLFTNSAALNLACLSERESLTFFKSTPVSSASIREPRETWNQLSFPESACWLMCSPKIPVAISFLSSERRWKL